MTKYRTRGCSLAALIKSSIGWLESLCYWALFVEWLLAPCTLVFHTLWKFFLFLKIARWTSHTSVASQSQSQPAWGCRLRTQPWSSQAWHLCKSNFSPASSQLSWEPEQQNTWLSQALYKDCVSEIWINWLLRWVTSRKQGTTHHSGSIALSPWRAPNLLS